MKRGDLVKYKDGIYYFQPNGNTCYLYKNLEDVGNISKKVFAPVKNSVTKITQNINILATFSNNILLCAVGESQKDNNQKIGYVYVGKDIEDHKNFYKIGFTLNLKKRLQTIKTTQPTFEFILKIKTTNPEYWELKLKETYKQYLYQGEIYKGINLDIIKKELKKWNFKPNNDYIFVKN